MAVARPLPRLRARTALGLALSSTLAACLSATPHGIAARPGAQSGMQPNPPAAALSQASPADAEYDWHGLMTAPFGSLLKDMPVALHEVLLFRDEAHPAAEAEEQDCYTRSGPQPSFAGRTIDEYLLCFKHDRLSRIEAAVRLPADDAAQVLSQVCAAWLRKAAPAAPDGRLGTTDSGCNGREDGIGFNAHLGPPSTPDSGPESTGTDVPLSITLSSAADRDAERGTQ